jgi:hypothetical protein
MHVIRNRIARFMLESVERETFLCFIQFVNRACNTVRNVRVRTLLFGLIIHNPCALYDRSTKTGQ